ncbi:hypothetical protein BH11PAT2_BH11PAT2_04030 [soil metagenome]
MKKLSMRYVGLLGIPLALLGVATSVATAAPKAPTTEVAPVVQTVSAQTATATDTDTETNDDSKVAGSKADTETAGTPEANDDASGPQEAPGTETAD